MILPRYVSLRATRIVALVLALVLASGCDSGNSDGDADQDAGTFSLQFGGDMSGALSGTAWFATGADSESGETYFAITLTSGSTPSATGQSVLLGKRGGRPGKGTFSFIDLDADSDVDLEDLPESDFIGLVFIDSLPLFVAAGELRIESSDNNQVTGTFQFAASGVTFANGVTEDISITLSGSFNAATSPSGVFFPI